MAGDTVHAKAVFAHHDPAWGRRAKALDTDYVALVAYLFVPAQKCYGLYGQKASGASARFVQL